MFLRLKVYAVAALAFIAAVLNVYLMGRKAGRDAFKAKVQEERLNAVLKAKEVKHEVDAWDDSRLIDVARGWVRDKRE